MDNYYSSSNYYDSGFSENNYSTNFRSLEQIDGSIFGFGVFGFRPPDCFSKFLENENICDLTSKTWKSVLDGNCKTETIDVRNFFTEFI